MGTRTCATSGCRSSSPPRRWHDQGRRASRLGDECTGQHHAGASWRSVDDLEHSGDSEAYDIEHGRHDRSDEIERKILSILAPLTAWNIKVSKPTRHAGERIA